MTKKEIIKKQLLFENFMNNIPFSVYFKDKEGRLFQVSKHYLKQKGAPSVKSPNKLIGKTDFDLYPENFAKSAREDELRIMETGKPLIGKEEKINISKDEELYLLTTKAPLYDDKGDIIGILGTSIDITEHKRFEEKLFYEKALLESLLDNIPDHIYYKDKKSRFIAVSESLAEWLGANDAADMIGKTDFDYFTDEHAKRAYQDEKRVMKTGKLIEGKTEKETHPDGRINWVSTTKIPRYDDVGNVIGILGISRDITEKKELEEKFKLRLEELGEEVLFKSRLLTSLLDNIPDRVYFKDKKSRFIQASKSVAEQFEVKSVNELIGKTDFDYFTKEHAELAYRDEQEIIKTGKPIEVKIEKETHPDGRITWVSSTKIPRYDEEGTAIGTLGISRDITDQVLAEKKIQESANKLKTIVNAVSEGLAIVDKKNVILEANDFLSELFGLKREDIINKKCKKIFPPWEETCKDCPLKKSFKNHEHSSVIEKTKVLKNGTIQYFSIQCYPIPNTDNKKTMSVISISDITDRKNMEKKNIQNYKRKMKNLSHKLTLAEEHERKRIATTLHAEIAQILAFLRIKIGELKEKESSENKRKSLNEVYNLVQKAIASTRSLMSQISPYILYELGFVPAVDWLAEKILKVNNIKYEFKNDRKKKDMTDDLSILLFQAVRELLTNIRKHAKAKNVKISIKRDGENIKIEISDDGAGFDTSILDSYVERDIGFGLLNIRSRIDVVGGHFEIESHKNKGTKIKLEAPLKS
jgi:PAS domain S-box-containing protein